MAEKKIYGVVGYPVKHSLSPLMHNAAFRELGIEAEYRLFAVAPPELDSFLSSLEGKNIYGLNITVPHKEKVLPFAVLTAETEFLKQIGAINTLVKKDNLWLGYNTDIPGFSRHLKENFQAFGKKAVLLGAGGAARAVSFALASSGIKEIALFDIDHSRAASVAAMIKRLLPNVSIFTVSSIEELDLINKDLLVNCTPVGMKATDPCLVQEKMLHKKLFCYDLIYNPAETKLLASAKKVGASTANGLGMLLYQGAEAFQLWTGRPAPLEVMRQALLKGVKNL